MKGRGNHLAQENAQSSGAATIETNTEKQETWETDEQMNTTHTHTHSLTTARHGVEKWIKCRVK